MSRDYDDEDDEPRPRRRKRRYDDDYDDAPRRGGRSGAVTGVGVLTIILGALLLVCGLCYSGIGLVAGGAAGAPGAPAGFGPLAGMVGGVLIIIALIILIFGALYLAGGIGCVQRHNWGRIMTLVMAGFSGVLAVLSLIGIVLNLLQPAAGGPPGFQEGRILGIFLSVVLMLLLFTHCVMGFVVLLSGQASAEFE
jgi:hypothetical protein